MTKDTLSLRVAVLSLLFVQMVLLQPAEMAGRGSATAAPSQKELNTLGFRGRPIEYRPDDFVVVLVGDSQVEAAAVPFAGMPETRLEHHLILARRPRVVSIGTEGYGQDQELLALREYFARFRADAVVVWETPGNDLWNNTFPTGDSAGRQPKPTFWLEQRMLKGPTAASGPVSALPAQGSAPARSRLSEDQSWEARLPRPYQPLTSAPGPVNTTWQSMWNDKVGTIRIDNMATEKSHQTIFLTPRSPRTQYSIDLTHRLLEEMAALSHAHGAAFSTVWVDTPAVEIPEPEAVYGLNGQFYRASYGQRHANMADINKGFDSYVVRAPVGDWRAGPNDSHLNERAVDTVMKSVAMALIPGFSVGPTRRAPGAN